MSSGIIYVAVGEKYIQEALYSVKSLKKVLPKIHTTIFCNQESTSRNFEPFDRKVTIDNNYVNYSNRGYIEKIRHMQNPPYKKNIFLDTDTYICYDISELFTMLDRFDVAGAHAPNRFGNNKYKTNVPESFPEINTGVLVFRKNDLTEALWQTWFEIYQKMPVNLPSRDQPAFREALYFSNIRLATLTPEYNFRLKMKRKQAVTERVKIIHGRHENLPKVARMINANPSSPRCSGYFITFSTPNKNRVSLLDRNRKKLQSIQQELN